MGDAGARLRGCPPNRLRRFSSFYAAAPHPGITDDLWAFGTWVRHHLLGRRWLAFCAAK